MPVVGTAGHVDHGKSTLILALTGRDPDRWAEEKRRGLTIDLGFAWTTLADGREVSFVDVPGHERFIKNMLAGIESIDVALMVVAADEGWMPQSEEHLAVLDLLDVKLGVIALTKIDRVDADVVELANLEIEERVAGTSLQGSPVIPVSATTNVGIEELRQALARAVAQVADDDTSDPRLWIDRSFTIAGAGTVVTGTLLDGPLSVGDEVMVWPPGATARVRGLQSHERDAETVSPRRRVAINLAGWDRHQVVRGAMLGKPGYFAPTEGIVVSYRAARYAEPIVDKGAFHLHIGSGAWPVRVMVIEQQEPNVFVHIDLPEPLGLRVGDRFVLREVGKRSVVGGGQVVDPAPRGRRRSWLKTIPALSAILQEGKSEQAETLLAIRGRASLQVLSAQTGGGVPANALRVGDEALSRDAAVELAAAAVEAVAEFHKANPIRPGMPLAMLASRLACSTALLERLVDDGDRLQVRNGLAALLEFQVAATDTDWNRVEQTLRGGGWAVPRVADLGVGTEMLHAWLREGKVVRVSADFFYLPEQLDEVVEKIRGFDGPFTVSQFKDAAGISRKYAVPLLEWADANYHTVRAGDHRTARR